MDALPCCHFSAGTLRRKTSRCYESPDNQTPIREVILPHYAEPVHAPDTMTNFRNTQRNVVTDSPEILKGMAWSPQ